MFTIVKVNFLRLNILTLRSFLLLLTVLVFNNFTSRAQEIPSPKDFFGFEIGDDYQLINYSQTIDYFKTVAALSDRIKLEDIGKTEEGRTQYMAVISSPGNLDHVEKYKQISQQLARAEIPNEKAERLINAGKPVVWIDGGLHSNETVGFMQLVQLYYELAEKSDDETTTILDNVIILLVIANPDGQELMADWYMKEEDPKERKKNIPRTYNKYVGHDNNRDFYMMTMKETQNLSRQLYIEWLPQIVYDHHQRGPTGTVLAGPPYRGPFSYSYDPLVMTSIDAVGAAMISRLNREEKPGYTRQRGSSFNTWWNGGLRNTTYFHNMIGLLTEIQGEPGPMDIPVVVDRLEPTMETPFPVAPQRWHFKKSIDYSMSLNYAVLNYAVKNAKDLLRNIYQMGIHSIHRGSVDHWTFNPHWKDELKDIGKKGQLKEQYQQIFKDPANRDPRGYIISSNQPDFPTAVRFVNAMIRSGIRVYKAKSDFEIEGITYPQGSYIIKTDQAFRPYVLDMFEPQYYPNDFQYEGGPPIAPYDVAGWTLALQMGIQFTKVRDDFDGPFKQINYGEIQALSQNEIISSSATGYLLSGTANNTFKVVNELLNEGVVVYRTTKQEPEVPVGSFYVDAHEKDVFEEMIKKYGLNAIEMTHQPRALSRISPAKIALFDRYGGYIGVGWTKWILDHFHFDYDLIFPKDVDESDLNKKYDVILFVDGGIPTSTRETKSQPYESKSVPQRYWYKLGRLSTDKSIPQLRKFVENGGTIVTVGSSTRLAYHFDLPVKNALRDRDGKLPSRDRYYAPTSVLTAHLNTESSANWGMADTVNLIFNNNLVYKITDSSKVTTIASFEDSNPLRSGWIWGANHLKNAVVAFSADMGKGKFYAFSPEITFRAQSHGTFKMLFNELYNKKD